MNKLRPREGELAWDPSVTQKLDARLPRARVCPVDPEEDLVLVLLVNETEFPRPFCLKLPMGC